MRSRSVVWSFVTALCVAIGVASASDAAAAPAPVSGLSVTDRTDHHIWVHFDLPADPQTVVARLTRGYTPAATPNAGYFVGVGNHIVQPGSFGAVLTADTVYTIAFWVRQGSVYSARRTVTARTLKDTTRPADLEVPWAPAPSVDPQGEAQVQLVWSAIDVEEDLAGTRIVRNTAPTTTGGTVFFVPAPHHSFVDDNPPVPADVTGPQPVVHYWLLSRDRAGNFGAHYQRLDVVVANRTLRGHVAPGTTLVTEILCCPKTDDVDTDRLVAGGYAAIALTSGDYTIHVPPGVYALCGERLGASTQTCYGQRPDGTIYTFGDAPPVSDDSTLPSLNLVTNLSLAGLDY